MTLREATGRPARVGVLLGALLALLVFSAPADAQAQGSPQPEGKHLPALTPVADDALTRALRAGEIDTARYALERATALFRPAFVRARYGVDVRRPGPRQATLVLRDLAVRLNELSPDERARAERLLARPTDGAADPNGQGYSVPEATPVCAAQFCIHYVPTSVDAPPPADVNTNLVPDWVETAGATMAQVWATETGALGFRPPLSDATSPNNGGDGRLDVYLANLGDAGIYGYCTTDDPNAGVPNVFIVSSYCVLDNDYLEPIFAATTPLGNLQVTSAHEFFHAVQAAHDFFDDSWFLEGTATWIEDEVYDDVNDNRSFLLTSPLTLSSLPLDWGKDDFEYGSWIFFRFLSERYGQDIVRTIWGRAAARPIGPDEYSLQAIAATLAGRGLDLRRVFNNFLRANRNARRAYAEGAAYPARPRTRKTWRLSASRRIRARTLALFQLSAETTAFRPGRGLGRRAKLELTLDLPRRGRGSEAAVLLFRRNGALLASRRITLSPGGNKTVRVGFGRGRVGRVELVLANASRRYACWVYDPAAAPWSCAGAPLDEGLAYSYRARALG